MNCPCCGAEMEKGGIVSGGLYTVWYPTEIYEKNALRRRYTIGKRIGTTSVIWKETKVPDAYYCKNCNKVTGIFDVEE